MTARLILATGWGLLIVGIAMLVGSVVALTFPSEYKSAPPTAAAAIIAVAGLLITMSRQIADKAEATSRFYLEEYRKGFDTAFEVLASATEADALLRVKWLAAARILATARRMATLVTAASHRDVISMDIPHQSQRFLPFLERAPRYYYGVKDSWVRVSAIPDLDEVESLHDAARKSTAPRGETLNYQRAVPETAVQTVWAAIKYPKPYDDVLGEEFSDDEVMFLPTGLRKYIEHSRAYHPAMEKLYQGGKEVPPPAPRLT